ncbi:MAG: type II secretion system F family protein [Verrucomicrobia bacterium]|nr:type II secretion system F family protein [Verrucomicrobiota bacterium]MDA1065602.1 type II secretion system F family protein [Verrucomicrobiota bacterium]
MPITSSSANIGSKRTSHNTKKKISFAESQRLAKQRSYEKRAPKHKVKLADLTIFTQQLGSMLDAGLPLVSCLDALQEQTDDQTFMVIIRDVKNDIASGTSFSDSVKKFPRAFNNLFTSMVEAGEASGQLSEILAKVAIYFEDSVKLTKKVKSALMYPIAVILLAVGLVNVLLIFVIPTFKEMFTDMGAKLPMPTQMLIDVSDWLKGNILFVIIGGIIFWKVLAKFLATPRGRVFKDKVLFRLPIVGGLSQKIAVSRFCRTFAILLRSGVPILKALDIVSRASGNTYIEVACKEVSRVINQGGQVSEVLAEKPYFPPMVKHMAKAGEQTGKMDDMFDKISDFYDSEIETTVAGLTSLMEPILICFLGIVIGGIVMAMFLPIFNMANVVGG